MSASGACYTVRRRSDAAVAAFERAPTSENAPSGAPLAPRLGRLEDHGEAPALADVGWRAAAGRTAPPEADSEVWLYCRTSEGARCFPNDLRKQLAASMNPKALKKLERNQFKFFLSVRITTAHQPRAAAFRLPRVGCMRLLAGPVDLRAPTRCAGRRAGVPLSIPSALMSSSTSGQ